MGTVGGIIRAILVINLFSGCGRARSCTSGMKLVVNGQLL